MMRSPHVLQKYMFSVPVKLSDAAASETYRQYPIKTNNSTLSILRQLNPLDSHLRVS